MQTEGQLIVLILAASVVLILAVVGLTIWWRRLSRNTIQTLAARIMRYDQQMEELSNFLQGYSGIDKEPFVTPLEDLINKAGELRSRVIQFLETCRSFEEEVTRPEDRQLPTIGNAPFVWFRRWRRSVELNRESRQINEQMAQVEEHVEQIYELPWDLAGECRQVEKDVDQFAQQVRWLQSKGTRGVTFQKAASQLTVMQQSLDGLPPAFLTAAKDELLEVTNMQITIRAFEIVSSVRPAIDHYLPQVNEWQTNLEKASAEYAGLKQVGANLRQALAAPPHGMEVSPLLARLDQVAQMATELNQRLTQPEAEQLKPLARETGHLRKVLEDLEQQYQRASQQVAKLHQSLVQLQEGAGKLTTQVITLERSQNYPLIWDESGKRLDGLRTKIQDLGSIQQLRSPEQILQQRGQAENLWEVYKGLSEKILKAAASHASLTALLNNPEIKDGDAWLKAAREVVAKAKTYDDKNWPKKDVPSALSEKLEELARLQSVLVPRDRNAPFKESGLDELLDRIRELSASYKELRPRLESVQTRLETLQSIESAGKDRLTASWSALEKAALLSESNPLLEEMIEKDIDRLGEEIRRLANELNAHDQGEIEKKAQRVRTHAEKINQEMSQWLIRFNGAIAEAAQKIGERLSQVQTVANLDEPVLDEARKLLQRPDVNNLAQGGQAAASSQGVVSRVTARIAQLETKTSTPSDLEIIAELKYKNDLWQTLSAVQLALEEKMEPLLTAHREVEKARDEARQLMAEVAKNFPEKRAWPPHHQAPFSEKQAVQSIDEKWEATRKKAARVEPITLELNRLTQQYHLAVERGSQVINRVEQDRERIQEIEWQIDSLKQRWQAQSDPSNAILQEGIQRLVNQAEARHSYIKQQFIRGAISYEQAIQNLQFLQDEIFTAEVPVDGQTRTGLNQPNRRTE